MSLTASAPSSEDGVGSHRSRALVWAVCLSAAAIVPLFGFYFCLAGCVVAVVVIIRRGYTVSQRSIAASAFVVGATLAAFWLWSSLQTFI